MARSSSSVRMNSAKLARRSALFGRQLQSLLEESPNQGVGVCVVEFIDLEVDGGKGRRGGEVRGEPDRLLAVEPFEAIVLVIVPRVGEEEGAGGGVAGILQDAPLQAVDVGRGERIGLAEETFDVLGKRDDLGEGRADHRRGRGAAEGEESAAMLEMHDAVEARAPAAEEAGDADPNGDALGFHSSIVSPGSRGRGSIALRQDASSYR